MTVQFKRTAFIKKIYIFVAMSLLLIAIEIIALFLCILYQSKAFEQ